MNNFIHNQKPSSKFLLVKSLACVALVGSIAVAEPRSPSANGPDPKAASAQAQGSRQPAPSQAESTVEQVKKWVVEKIHDVQSYFFSDGPADGSADGSAKVALPATKKPHPVQQTQTPALPIQPHEVVREPAASALAEQTIAAAPAAPVAGAPAAAVPGVVRKTSGVQSYDLKASAKIPRLNLERETPLHLNNYLLDAKLEQVIKDRVIHALDTPSPMDAGELQHLLAKRVGAVEAPVSVKLATGTSKGKIDRSEFDKLSLALKPEVTVALKKYVPLTKEETIFLSGLLLYQQGEQCPSALGLFHKLAKISGWEAESNFYLAMCSKQMSLMTDFYDRARKVLQTQDVYYSKKVLAEVGYEIPYELSDDFGEALLKVSSHAKIMDGLKPEVLANVSFLLADYCVTSEHFKSALLWAGQVPATHPKYLKAQFLLALAEYQAGSKENAIKIQDRIVNDKTMDKANLEFQAIVALNAGRMHFQEQNFKNAHENFQKVYKDHPLWLQSLTEMGWSQLMDGDYEGAIGNMYSIQSPFFTAVYKPESYVIRTIGYINLCQYGDAYKTLSILEHDYRPYLTKMESYIAHSTEHPSYYQTVRSFMSTAGKAGGEVDGLPSQVVREMARHRDFTNLQKALNRLVDERPNYAKVNGEVEKSLKRAQSEVISLRSYNEGLRRKIKDAIAQNNPIQRDEYKRDLEQGLEKLNNAFFRVDLYGAAKAGMDDYRAVVVSGADKRIVAMRGKVEHVLANRLLKMKVDLARMLDNNELLRYEVFAGSGENLRYQVAGGEVAKRVPASILPKSKSLQWEFDGEYWEDEIGHYRSSLKNNCPNSNHERAQASLDGGIK